MILETPAPGLKQKILQAPMSGYTDLAFRQIARRFGCALAFCEMVKDRAVLEDNEQTRAMLATADWDHPLGMQLIGRDPKMLSEAAVRLVGLGADLIDFNVGCPVRKVVSDGCGAALLKEPALVARILEKLVPAVRVPVTVKMRIGFDEEDDGYLEIVRIACASGVAAITVHGRTRRQLYSGRSNWDAIGRAKRIATVPVIGNGDIHSGADAERMMRQTGCDGVMVARGAVGNPWIYRDIAARLAGDPEPVPPAREERARVLGEHFEVMRAVHGDRIALACARRIARGYVRGLPGALEVRRRVNRTARVAEFHELVRDFARGE